MSNLRRYAWCLLAFLQCSMLATDTARAEPKSSGVQPALRMQPRTTVDAWMRSLTPHAKSPDRFAIPPMPRTRTLPASEMLNAKPRRPQSQIVGLGWTQVPGLAQSVAASPDGSFWVVSGVYYAPIGNGIWHYANGSWSNIPGAATRLSVGPDGTLWAINGSGGIYSYANGMWTGIAGGASDISVAADGSIYVISSVPGNVYGNAIYRYVDGVWTQMPGFGTRIAASWDPGSYAGGISAGGFYVVNALGSIYYYSPSAGYTQLPGVAAQVAPTMLGGLFALGYPTSSVYGDPIYYRDLSSGIWNQQAGAAMSIAENASGLVAVNAVGSIYTSPVTVAPHLGPSRPLWGPQRGPYGAWGPNAVAQQLGFPVQQGFDGTGTTVAIVVNSNVSSSDVQEYLAYFETPGTSRSISYELIDGASSIPSQGVDEASLDVQTVAGLAPGANVTLYVTPALSYQDEIDAYNAVLSDGKALVVSSSFSGCEAEAPTSGLSTLFATGASDGIAFIASSGDQGNTCFAGLDANGNDIYEQGVGYPASDPSVIGVGGSESEPPQALVESTVWNDYFTASGDQEASGGGVSTVFSLPSYQQGLPGAASQQFRNVPDLSMPADDSAIVVNGQWQGENGTSWGAPQFAAMLAEIDEYCGGYFTDPQVMPYFAAYRSEYRAFVDVVAGTNQYILPSGPAYPAYPAGIGYDNASGIGIPLGVPFAQMVCPNGVPVSASFVRRDRRTANHTSRRRVVADHAPAIAAGKTRPDGSMVLDLTPRSVARSNVRRKPPNDIVRFQLVLKNSPHVATDELSVIATLRQAGFTVVQTFKNHLVVDATGSTRTAETYFKTTIDDVVQGRNLAYAPVSSVTVPASLAPYVAGINLDTVVRARTPHLQRNLQYR